MGSGVVFFDYDTDGDADLYFVNSGNVPQAKQDAQQTQLGNVLYRNDGDGRFTDVTETSGTGDTGYGMAAAAADIDNDGDADLYVANFGQDVLYRNNGDGTFTDITEAAGIDNTLWGIAAVYLDFDVDGDLDIFVVNYLVYELSMPVTTFKGIVGYGHPRSYEGTPDVLYQNNGDGTFTNIAETAGVTNSTEGRGMAAVACDYDNDGLPDIYVTNDTNRNFLYRNNGDGTFTDESLFIGVGYDESGVAEGSMGIDCGDYNSDGWLDLIVANSEKATLYKNEEGLFFADATAESGLQQLTLPFVGFSPLFLDYDNDGHLDLFCANGHPQDVIEMLMDHETYAQRDQMFQNRGDGTYADVSETAGAYFTETLVGRAAATADYDNDGDTDIVIMNSNQRAVLLRNDGGNANNWIGIKLIGSQRNRDGIGAKVTVSTADLTQMREVKSGSSYASGSDTRLLFGLGESQRVEKIAIVWQRGTTQVLENVSINQTLTIVASEQ
ncbi:CRTAC1 family protein [Candidatus Poribacteria bacterium]|nr:CRTAC1 family protein [Candidatus Poribacteria bacterium]MYG08456.1 CRTAC1 family protein [Candidatus Poribacteria bacterium]MYK23777.1 CRTAC1 family protein [Candidatus Poribacteria bacterium]